MRALVFVFLKFLNQEGFLKVQVREVVGASPSWACVLALSLASCGSRRQSPVDCFLFCKMGVTASAERYMSKGECAVKLQ